MEGMYEQAYSVFSVSLLIVPLSLAHSASMNE